MTKTVATGMLLTLLGSQGSIAAPRPTPIEKRLLAAAGAENPHALQLLETLVNINSGTMNIDGVKHVGDVMRAQLEPLGFQDRWVPMTAVGRAGVLVARHKGSGHGKRVLLIGHLDTVFEKESPFQKFERHQDTAEGPGVNDMKDGLAIIIASLAAMKQAGTLGSAQIAIVLSDDEENAARPIAVSRADMREAAAHSDVALEFESLATDDGHDIGTISRRSALAWTVRNERQVGPFFRHIFR